MLLKSLKTHFPARVTEWLMSGVLFTWGYYVVTHPQIFTNPETAAIFRGIGSIAEWFGQPPVTMGIMALLTGFARACALFVNGAVTKTPLVRLLTAFMSAYLWTSICVGLWLSGVESTGLVVYPWFVIADVISGYRAGYDLVIAENTAKITRAQRNDRDSGTSRFRSLLVGF